MYKAKKKEILLSDYICGTSLYTDNVPAKTGLKEYNKISEIKIDEDEIPF